ncbi:MAG TPA: cobalamin-independent methionine synthase II family protein [Xanthobacteraceae bacterium]|jgi:5-methyltetrahydropteroyltriglutamate--homocysteine methyltransferase
MKRNTDRIQTTHVGSLPRPDDLTRLMYDVIDEKPVDKSLLSKRVAEAVREVVNQQRAAGVDIISDGEMSKTGFSNYVVQRFSGFGERGQMMLTDMADVPLLTQKMFSDEGGQHVVMPVVTGPIELRDGEAVKVDIANLKSALGSLNPDNAFIPAVTPGQMLFNFANRHYPSREAYLEAAGNALRPEYQAIIDAGFNLQLDSPDLAMHHHGSTDGPIELKDYIPLSIEALNHATRGLPPEKMRLHLCWGNYAGPHHYDVALSEIIEPIIKTTTASFISFVAANPRHEHEYEVWNDVKLPDDKVIMPGAIDTITNTVEHPMLVAQRIERFANIVGKENVIAGTDCGFSTFVGFQSMDAKVTWLKLEALAEGARIASERLW